MSRRCRRARSGVEGDISVEHGRGTTAAARYATLLRMAARIDEGAPPHGGAPSLYADQAMALTSSGMPGPNVVDTAPFWM